MFCSCSASYQDSSPNTVVCPVCMGMPGVLPVINKFAVGLVVKTGLALNCTISTTTKFDRKNYPYPDLMKGYQISQYDLPLAMNGFLSVLSNGDETKIGITRVHLEEDVAKLIHRTHSDNRTYSLLDINRSGVPLMEVVSEPDIRSADEAISYLTRLRTILQYIDASTANMEEGNFRCDANISIRPKGHSKLGAKVEVKNMNSFRSVHQALEYEADRQIKAIHSGQTIAQETRGWIEEKSITVSQRSKEHASDYRYFPEPDLPPITLDPKLVSDIHRGLPELPEARKARFVSQFALPEYDADLLTSSKKTADFFELVVTCTRRTGKPRNMLAKGASNWILGELTRLLNLNNTNIGALKIRPEHIVELLDLIEQDVLSNSMAKNVFETMFASGIPPKTIVSEHNMVQITDADIIKAAIDEAIANNPQPVHDYINGKETALRFLVGQVMKITKGKANPKLAAQLLQEKLT